MAGLLQKNTHPVLKLQRTIQSISHKDLVPILASIGSSQASRGASCPRSACSDYHGQPVEERGLEKRSDVTVYSPVYYYHVALILLPRHRTVRIYDGDTPFTIISCTRHNTNSVNGDAYAPDHPRADRNIQWAAPAIGSPSPMGMTFAGLEQSLAAMLKNETEQLERRML